MARTELDTVANLSEPTVNRDTRQFIQWCSGDYTIKIKPSRLSLSGRQRGWYFGEIVKRFMDFLREQHAPRHDKAYCHTILKAKNLTEDVLHPITGRLISRRVRSLSELDTFEMSVYCDKSRAWLLDFFGIRTMDPGEYDPKLAESKTELETQCDTRMA